VNEAVSPLRAWTDFYVIVGSSAAALTGLMFVVITLVAGIRVRTTRDGISAFSTPTVVHFCSVLFVAAAITAPWPRLACASALLTVAALIGTAYAIHIASRATKVEDYTPDLEDRLCYIVLPVVGYLAVLVSSAALAFRPVPALFGLAGASLLLIFLGIHNAWDIVTYLGVKRLAQEPADDDDAPSPAPAPPQPG